MKTSLIIAKLDPSRNVICGLPACRVHFPMDEFDFQGAIDALGHGIVIAYPGASNGLGYPQLREFPCVLG